MECGPAWPCGPKLSFPPSEAVSLQQRQRDWGEESCFCVQMGEEDREEGPVLPGEQREVVVRELCYIPNHSLCEMPGYFFPLSIASTESLSLGQDERVPLSLTDTNCSGFWLTTNSPVALLLEIPDKLVSPILSWVFANLTGIEKWVGGESSHDSALGQRAMAPKVPGHLHSFSCQRIG